MRGPGGAFRGALAWLQGSTNEWTDRGNAIMGCSILLLSSDDQERVSVVSHMGHPLVCLVAMDQNENAVCTVQSMLATTQIHKSLGLLGGKSL